MFRTPDKHAIKVLLNALVHAAETLEELCLDCQDSCKSDIYSEQPLLPSLSQFSKLKVLKLNIALVSNPDWEILHYTTGRREGSRKPLDEIRKSQQVIVLSEVLPPSIQNLHLVCNGTERMIFLLLSAENVINQAPKDHQSLRAILIEDRAYHSHIFPWNGTYASDRLIDLGLLSEMGDLANGRGIKLSMVDDWHLTYRIKLHEAQLALNKENA